MSFRVACYLRLLLVSLRLLACGCELLRLRLLRLCWQQRAELLCLVHTLQLC